MFLSRFLRPSGSRRSTALLLGRCHCSTTSSPPAATTITHREVRALFRETDLDLLAARFKDLSSSSAHFRRMSSAYSGLINRLISAGRPDAATDVLEAQKLTPGITNEGFAARLICLYGKAGMADRAAETFDQLPSLGRPHSVLLFNSLLSAFTSAGELAGALKAWQEITAANPEIVPDIYSYNTLIHAHCQKQDMEGAMCFFREMEEKGLTPNVITYGSLVNGFYRANMPEDAEKMWTKMEESNCVPDVKCFNAKLRGMVSTGRVAEAEELLKSMKAKEAAPDAYSFTALIMGYCANGDLNGAKRVFAEMRKRSISPNIGTYQALVPKLLEAGRLGEPLKLCKESLFRKLTVNAEVLQAVADALAKAGRTQDAKALVELAWSGHCTPETLKLPSECSASSEETSQ